MNRRKWAGVVTGPTFGITDLGWGDIGLANISFGQGISVTPLHIDLTHMKTVHDLKAVLGGPPPRS